MEFRGFVYNRKLTALSQYNYLIHSERLCHNKINIADLIKTFYDTNVAPKLSHANFNKNFVIDFAVFSSNIYPSLLPFFLNINEIKIKKFCLISE